jgi:Xaa-Pro aminopeptidase
VRIFTHVGEQIKDVVSRFRELVMAVGMPPLKGKPKVGMQLFFHTPAFLVDLFRKVNPMVELVSSESVMNELRKIKEPKEIESMTCAQRIAGQGMDRVRELLRPGATAQGIASEALYTMMKAGSPKTSTPLYFNFGVESCMLHGRLSAEPLKQGDLAVIDLTPVFDGYCANLARTFVIGEPDEQQRNLLDCYSEMKQVTRQAMLPGSKVKGLDDAGKEVCERYGLGEYHIEGISHGIGLRFEETPASTIVKTDRNVVLEEGMTLTIGHTILAIPGYGGVRHEDIYRVTPSGGEVLFDYPIDPVANN